MQEARQPNLVQRAAKFALSALVPDWFGPNQPLTPVAPPAAVEGRQFDYAVGANMNVTPKVEATAIRATTFQELRWLADSTEALRLIIETRKDKVCGMEWGFRVRGARPADSRKDPRVKWLERFYRRPDGVTPFDAWLRSIQEDLIVLDAPAVHVRRDGQGRVLAFEQVDGATIKPLMDEHGRRPEVGGAYMHVLHGMSAVFYSPADLQYRPRNPRVHSLYGFGPVEQIQVYANMAIRRQIEQLGFFTEGNMPEGFVPVAGTAEQVEKFQRIWDAGEKDAQKKRRIRFIPADNASKFVAFKDPILADAFDEWMARVSCYAMSEDPTPFLKQVNRATAEQNRDNAQADGLNVQVRWVKSFLDEQIQDYLGFEDVEAFVVPARETDPEKVTKRVVALFGAGIISQEEAREEEGYEGSGPAPKAPEAPPPSIADAKPQPESSEPQRVERRSPAAAATASRTLALKREAALADIAAAWLDRAATIATNAALENLTQAQRSEDLFLAWIDAIDFHDEEIARGIEPIISRIFEESARIALGAESTAPVKVGFLEESAQFARSRGSWLVGKHFDSATGTVVEAIRPEYRISDECRRALRTVVSQAQAGSWTPDSLADEIRAQHGFSRARALNIARTEVVFADEAGKSEGWDAVGVPMEQKSVLGTNENHGADDIENAAQGWIPLGQPFASGHEAPPYHPACMCTRIARKAHA